MSMWDNSTPVHAAVSKIMHGSAGTPSMWGKFAAHMGRLIKSPTDTVPDVELGMGNRIQQQQDKNYFVGSSSDGFSTVAPSGSEYTRP